jgi:hypothetical protein
MAGPWTLKRHFWSCAQFTPKYVVGHGGATQTHCFQRDGLLHKHSHAWRKQSWKCVLLVPAYIVALTAPTSSWTLSRRRWCFGGIDLATLPLCCYPFLARAASSSPTHIIASSASALSALSHISASFQSNPTHRHRHRPCSEERNPSPPEACSLGHDSFACADDHHIHTHSQEWLPSEKTCSVWSTSCRTWSSTPSAMILWISRRLFVPPSRLSEDIDHALTLPKGHCRLPVFRKILCPREHCWP